MEQQFFEPQMSLCVKHIKVIVHATLLSYTAERNKDESPKTMFKYNNSNTVAIQNADLLFTIKYSAAL